MALKASFLTYTNFELAFKRLVRGQNRDYKQHYSHLLSSYNLGMKRNLEDLINDIKTNSYQPSPPTVIFAPKPSGVLRPLKLLTVRDLIVYQALANKIATSLSVEQQKFKFKRCFGAIFAGKTSPFFYVSWKVSYGGYSSRLEQAFRAGNVYVADFDLVSFYDLIDHSRLKTCLAAAVKDAALLDLLFRCLATWTVQSKAHLGHGVPQGPEPSAFLAECLLFDFDATKFRDVVYARYVDDIRIMGKDEIPVRRALLRLDLKSKELGLVPQAQKIALRKVKTLSELRKSLPSGLVASVAKRRTAPATQKKLLRTFRRSLARENGKTIIRDITAFKFSLLRLNPTKKILRRIRPLLIGRPDCSWVLSRYFRKFPNDREAADMLLDALKRDPTYDASASHYIDAMDLCEPATGFGPYRRVIRTVNRRSEERSIVLAMASNTFLGRRYGAAAAIKRIEKQTHPLVRSTLVNRLFGGTPNSTFTPTSCLKFLQQEASHADADAARFSAAVLLQSWPWLRGSIKLPAKTINRSVKLLMVALGLRQRGPHKVTVLEAFFREKQKILIPFPWKKALAADWREAERRCLELQKLLVGNPGTRLLLLDTFNELLVQNFSTIHSSLQGPYKKASGKFPQPDWGNWLSQPFLKGILPVAAKWFKEVHDARIGNELAHALTPLGIPLAS